MPCYQPFRGDSAQLLLFKIASCLEDGGGAVTAAQIIDALGCTPACEGDVVNSFNGQTGDVVLTLADISTLADGRYVLKAGDTMTGALVHPVGTAALPSITFTGDLDTGVYHPAANTVGLSAGGALILSVSPTALSIIDGTAALPSLTFQSDTDTGLYRIGANVLGASVGGVRIVSLNSVGLGVGTDGATFKLDLVGTATTAHRKIGINGFQVVYLPDQATNFNSSFFGNGGGSVSGGSQNTGVGMDALLSVTSGDNNTAVGSLAIATLTTGGLNTGVGREALTAVTSGSSNVGIGYFALAATTTGTLNTAIGSECLASNILGSRNTGFGNSAGMDIVSAAGTGNNSLFGYNTGRGITTGVNNTIIGAGVTGLAAALSNNIIIADGSGNQRIQVGSTGIVTIPIALALATAAPLTMASGANQRAGDAVLVGGTVTVANTTVTANTRVFLTRKVTGGTIGFAVTYTVIAATSFTITSDNVLDTSTYSYLLIGVP